MIKNGIEFNETTVTLSNFNMCIFCGKALSRGEKAFLSTGDNWKMYICSDCSKGDQLIPAIAGNVISYGGRIYAWIGKGIRGTHKCDITGKVIHSGEPCWWSSAKRGKGQSYLTKEGIEMALTKTGESVKQKIPTEKRCSLPASILQGIKNRVAATKQATADEVAVPYDEKSTTADSKADKIGRIAISGGNTKKSIIGSDIIDFFKVVMELNIIDGKRVVDDVTGKCFCDGLFDFVSEDFSIVVTVNATERHECYGKQLYNLIVDGNTITINSAVYEVVDGRWILRRIS